MKTRFIQRSLASIATIWSISVTAAIHYVDVNSTNAVAPYTNWTTAANIIQDAVDAAQAGDEIVVTDGVYETGGQSVFGLTHNRVAITKPLVVRSVNGPEATLIRGHSVPGVINHDDTVRCAYLNNGAVLVGFTLTRGSTRLYHGGGAVWCQSSEAKLFNCVLVDNFVPMQPALCSDGIEVSACRAAVGGASYGGTLYNCKLINNSAYAGGAAYGSVLINCTISGNTAVIGGGVVNSTLTNCIVYYNSALDGGSDHNDSTLNYSCTTQPPIGDVGNISTPPQFVNASIGNFRLQSNSPCINAGQNTNAPSGLDLDGNPRIALGTVDMGAYEFQPTIHYVNVNSATPISPYTNWATAANVIQDAVDAALPNDEIVVTNGIYATGGRTDYLGVSNRVAVLKPLLVRSVHGPDVTVIRGFRPHARYSSDGGPGRLDFLSEPIRCAYLTNGAALLGFTLTEGASMLDGGGVFSESTASVTTCVITGCSASESGGGAFGGILENCVIRSNLLASVGGGVCGATLKNCSLSENLAAYVGGGAANSILNNCLVINNAARYDGGGVANFSTFANFLVPELRNCTIAGNSADREGGGVWSFFPFPPGRVTCTGAGGPGTCGVATEVNNCIVYGNNAPQGANQAGGQMFYSCTTPLPTNGVGNITNAPLFVGALAGNFRLQPNSPCINAGRNTDAPAGLDLDGKTRIAGETVDMGAYEEQLPASRLSYAWLMHYGFALDGSADFGDSDGDGYTNLQEWQRETKPNDPRSFPFRLTPPVFAPGGAALSWESVAGRHYSLERSTNAVGTPVFTPVAQDITGQLGITAWTDWDSNIRPPHALYRVRLIE